MMNLTYGYNFSDAENMTTPLNEYDFFADYYQETYGFRYSLPITVLYCFAFILVFVIGIIGNSFVVAVVIRAPSMHSVTNIFIANLAVADLLVNVICLPFTLIANTFQAWVLGRFICKSVTYLQGVSVSASINTLVAISVDRALAICFPMRCQMTSRTCRAVIIVIWLFSLTITIPWVLFFEITPIEDFNGNVMCTESWPNEGIGNLYFVLAHLIMCYVLPLVVITFCYILIWRKVSGRQLPGEKQQVGVALMMHRSKMKVIKMLLVVVVVFALSWLPLYVLFTRVKLGSPSETEYYIIHITVPIAQWLGTSNSCINPILYAFFNNKFRAGFKAILVSKSCCSPLRLDSGTQRYSSTKMHHLSTRTSNASMRYSDFSASYDNRRSFIMQVPSEGSLKNRSPPCAKSKDSSGQAIPMSLYRQSVLNSMRNGAGGQSVPNIRINGESTMV